MISYWFFQSDLGTPGRRRVFPVVLSIWLNDNTKTQEPSCLEPVFFGVQAVRALLFEEELKGGVVILSLRRIWMSVLRFFAKDAQNDRGCGHVILNAVKDLAFFILRFFAKEA